MKNASNIIIPDEANYNTIVDNINKAGKSSVHFLVDFDKTLTRAFIKGEEYPSLIAILRKNKAILGQEYAEKAEALHQHYGQIERDPNLAKEEKSPYMYEWWTKHLALLVESGLQEKHIKQAVDSGYLEFRDGIEEFLFELSQKSIPLVVISANGIGGDSIRMFFEKHNLMTDNIHIISNTLTFDEKGVASGFKKNVIHSFNKTEAVVEGYPEIFQKIREKTNVILMGDSLGDPDMIDGFNFTNLLKVGFFNNKPGTPITQDLDLLSSYKKAYDLILTGDSNMDVINSLVRKW